MALGKTAISAAPQGQFNTLWFSWLGVGFFVRLFFCLLKCQKMGTFEWIIYLKGSF
jgi:hypothetical protein